jgi:16S rRNA (cytosine967-C5)-methyltransferase
MADAARLAAYDVLRSVRVDDAYANLALAHVLRDRRLTGRDAGFVTELAAGTLRGQGTYDAVIDVCLDRGKVKPRVRDVLRLGAHQLLAMRVPTHAAVSATVDLARSRTGAPSAGLVNAVLRRIGEHDLAGWVERIAPDAEVDRLGHLAVAHNHPRWVVAELEQALGDRAGELADLLAADNAAPDVVLVSRPGRSDRSELPGEPTSLSPYGVRLGEGDPGAVPAVAEGRAGVQDEGSQLVAVAVAAAPIEGRDERWLDLCAGPGGKAALLAALASERGARLVANDVQPHRADLVRRALVGADGVEEVTTYDGRQPPWVAGSFDRVLVDAPCSGLGALRRRPEARWRKQPDDVVGLVPLQRDLLGSALDLVRPGGVVLYATCSPLLAETAEVVDAVLTARPDAALEPLGLDVADAAGPLPGTVQLWPHRQATDAMFLALVRTSAG